MSKTMLNIKTDVKTKQEAQKIAKEIGVPLSTIVNAQLKKFIRERRVELIAPLVPNVKTAKILASIEKDLAEGNKDAFSPAFSNSEDAMEWLNA